MGCGVSCPNITFDGDWEVADPFGQSLDIYRKTRDEIERRVNQLAEARE
jgi:protein-tyrosine-phosphatase